MDLEKVLDTSLRRWGDEAEARYSQLILASLDVIARDPLAAGSQDRSDVGKKVRCLHLRHVEGDVSAAVHVVFYRATRTTVVVIAMLHERMDPRARRASGKQPIRRAKS